MENKTDINGLWKFHDDTNNISGLAIGNNKEEARMNALAYIREFFDDLIEEDPVVYVWRIEEDNDYYCDYAIAISY